MVLALFDRFDERWDHLSQKERTLQSIEDEVFRFLTTQSSYSLDRYEELIKNQLNRGVPGLYGIPPLPLSNPKEPDFWARFMKVCEKALVMYEPRIQKAAFRFKESETPLYEVILEMTLLLDFDLGSLQREINLSSSLSKSSNTPSSS